MAQQKQPTPQQPPEALIVPTEGMTIAAWEAAKAGMERDGYQYAPTVAVFTRPGPAPASLLEGGE